MLHLLLIFICGIIQGVEVIEGADMMIQPSTVVLGGINPPDIAITCSLSANDTTRTDIQLFNYIRINRNRTIDHHDYFSPLIMKLGDLDPMITSSNPDVAARNPKLSGSLVIGDSTTPTEAELKLSWNSGTVTCEDDGKYECEISYLDKNSMSQSLKSTATLHVQSTATNPTIHGSINGVAIGVNEGTISNKANASVGDVVELNCLGYIGVDPITTIEWHYISPSDSGDHLRQFSLTSHDAINTAPANYSESHCSYVKTSTLRYQIRDIDATRTNNLAFSCASRISKSDTQVLLFSNKMYIDVAHMTTTTSLTSTTSTQTTTELNTTINTFSTAKLVVPTHVETTQHVVPTHADTTQHVVPTNAETTQHVVPTHGDTTQHVVPTHADTTQHVVPTHADTTQHVVPTHADTTQHVVPTHADTTKHVVPTHATTTQHKVPTHADITTGHMDTTLTMPTTQDVKSTAVHNLSTIETTHLQFTNTVNTTVSASSPRHSTIEVDKTAIGEGLVCLSCKSVVQPRHCHTVQRCLPDQSCGVETVVDQFGDVYYDVGCMNNNVCSGSRVKRGSACRECCNNELCNAKGCGEPGYPDSIGPVCYSCNMLPLGRQCHTMAICQRHQQCFRDQTEEFGDILVTSGCRSSQTCQELTSGGAGSSSLVGRRSLFSESQSGRECVHCCQDNLCNDKCPISPCEDKLSSCPYLALTLNICANASMAQECRLSCHLCQVPASATSPSTTTTSTTTTPTTPTTTTPPTTTPCFDTLPHDSCSYLITHLHICSNKSVATDAGCRAACGYCDSVSATPPHTTTVIQTTTPKVMYKDCLDIHTKIPTASSGVYDVYVTDRNTNKKRVVQVWCDMISNGGGWTVFQKRFNGSVDFYKGIVDYENGFGDKNGEFWLGLKNIYDMTAGKLNTLRVDVYNYHNVHTYENYDGFYLGPQPNYKFHLNHRLPGSTADGKLLFYAGASFSTKDMDRDTFTSDSCARRYHGSFWYSGCVRDSNPNGLYKPGPDQECDYYAMSYSNCDGNSAIEMKFK